MPIQDLQNFLDQLNKQTELTPAEIEVREKLFSLQIYGTANAGEAREKLKDFFFTEPKETIEKSKRFWYSYWRWYSMLNWSGFLGLSEADMLFCLAYQVPMAVVLDYNPADELRRYLALNYPFKEDLVAFYVKAQAAFLASEGYVGMWQGKEVYLFEIVKELTDTGFEEDSLRQAEFENKLSQVLFPSNESVEKYFFASNDVAVKKFISLVIFLQSVDEDEIELAVDSFMHPEQYTDKVLAEISSGSAPLPRTSIPSTPTKPSAPAVAKPSTPTFPIAKPTSPLPSPAKPATPVKPTLDQIKSQIESQFKKDAEGNFEDVENILAMLGTLSEKYNEPKIAEMLYFDEKENKFKWNT